MVNLLLSISLLSCSDETFLNAQSQFVTQYFAPYMNAISCSIYQDQNEWTIKYRFDQPIDFDGFDINISGYVSNSSANGHEKAKFSRMNLENKYSHLIKNNDPIKQCDEVLSYEVANRDLTIRLRHNHVFQSYIPLFGTRRLKIKNGKYTYFGTIDLIAESKYIPAKLDYMAAKDAFDIWNKKENVIYFNSDSEMLHDSLGEYMHWNYFRFPEIPIKPTLYNKYKLSFWYKILKGSEGTFNLRFDEYQQDSSVSSWSVKNNVKIDLKKTGEWIYYSSIITLNENTNAASVSFSFYDSNFGEAWVKEVDFRSIKKIPGLSGQIIGSEDRP